VIKKLWTLMGIYACICVFALAALLPAQPAAVDAVQAMIERVIIQDKLSGDRAIYFRALTSQLFEYLRTVIDGASLKTLCLAGTGAELGRLVEKQLGQSVLDFGQKMFAFFEARTVETKGVDLKTWRTADSDHFAFYYRPGSAAERDLDFIRRSSEEAFLAMVSCLGLEAETQKTFRVLKTDAPQEQSGPEGLSPQGRIAVFLFPVRADGAKTLKFTMGNMSFGATIAKEPGAEKGVGRLTARINVLYLNAFSLAVLHHEIGHAALFLGHYDPTVLAAGPLGGEADLKKAFFAGYKPLPPFLHEGVGDYVIYFQTFYKYWPLLPPPASLSLSLRTTKDFIPLETLLREGARFRAQRHKAYSLEAATVIDYLLRAFGREKLRAWFLAPAADSREAFKKIYGFGVKELEEKWTVDLKAKSDFRP